jgi:hypothetical protein
MSQVNKPQDNSWIELYAKQVGEYFTKEDAKDSSRKAVLEKELAKQPQK